MVLKLWVRIPPAPFPVVLGGKTDNPSTPGGSRTPRGSPLSKGGCMVANITQIFTTIMDIFVLLTILAVLGTTPMKPKSVLGLLIIMLSYIMSLICMWR